MSKASIETILCLPHNQYRFKYKVNDGTFHFINSDKAFTFFSKYVKEIKNLRLLRDSLLSFIPFIIIPSENEIFQLSKSTIKDDTRSHPLENLSEKDLNRIKKEIEEENVSERYPNDNLIVKIASAIVK